jgi:hypothetical protein
MYEYVYSVVWLRLLPTCASIETHAISMIGNYVSIYCICIQILVDYQILSPPPIIYCPSSLCCLDMIDYQKQQLRRYKNMFLFLSFLCCILKICDSNWCYFSMCLYCLFFFLTVFFFVLCVRLLSSFESYCL